MRSAQPRSPSRWPWIAAWSGGLLLSLFDHELASAVDFAVQECFFRGEATNVGVWLIDSDAMVPRLVFYLGPKWLTIAAIVGLGLWLLSDRLRGRPVDRWVEARWRLLLVLICVSAMVGLIKRYSGVWCPKELIRYGGEHAYRLLLQGRADGPQLGQCFTGGRASAGFA